MDRLAVVSRHIGRPEAPLPAASADRSDDANLPGRRRLPPAADAAARAQRPAAPVPRREAQQQRPLLRRSPSTPSHAAGRLHRYRRYGRTFPTAADTQQEVRLYGAEYSVYTRIARLVLEECSVSYSLLEVDIFGAEDELPADYLRRHPFREQHRPSACSLSPEQCRCAQARSLRWSTASCSCSRRTLSRSTSSQPSAGLTCCPPTPRHAHAASSQPPTSFAFLAGSTRQTL